MAPQLVFGTASFGMDSSEFQDAESVTQILRKVQDLGINHLDTGARYPPLSPGRAEELIGESGELGRAFIVDTKVYTDTKTDGSGDLTFEAMRKSVDGSLRRLQRPEGVNVLYAHRADPSTPLEEQIQAFNEQIKLGHCKTWGVSNTPPDVLSNILRICEENGWQKPTCYQGDYNLVTRGMETRLLPILRAHGMSFYCFRGLAAGFLTGKLVSGQHGDTRFGDKNPLGAAMQRVYGAPDLHETVKKFDAAAKAHGVTPMEVAIRWLAHHSALGDNDRILLGASKTAQIVETVAMIKRGPLPDEMLALCQPVWDSVKETRGEVI